MNVFVEKLRNKLLSFLVEKYLHSCLNCFYLIFSENQQLPGLEDRNSPIKDHSSSQYVLSRL